MILIAWSWEGGGGHHMVVGMSSNVQLQSLTLILTYRKLVSTLQKYATAVHCTTELCFWIRNHDHDQAYACTHMYAYFYTVTAPRCWTCTRKR
eukprot:1159320-Pelagomonas_calceolata.AAC.8